MSTPVDTSFTGLKAITAQIMGIISSARQIPLGPSHFALTAQVTSLVADVVKEYGTSPHIPGLMLSCSKELMRVRGMTPQVWPNWHSIGYDNPRLMKHSWSSKIMAWEALGDHTFDLPVTAPPSTGLIPVDLPSLPVIASNVPGSSTNPTTEYRTRGKAFVELEDDDEPISSPFSGGSCWRLSSPGLHNLTQGLPIAFAAPWCRRETLQLTATGDIWQPPGSFIEAGDILIPTEQPIARRLQQARTALRNSVRQEDRKPMHVVCLLLDKEDQVHLGDSGSPPICSRAPSTNPEGESRTPSKGSPPSQSKARTRSQSRGLSGTPAVTAVTTPKTQTRGRSKTITAIKAPAPAPAPLPSSSSAVPRAALDVPMPDLHGMAIAIRDAAARIAILEARVVEQDGKFDTLQRLHEGLRREIVDRHPSFPLPDLPANATSLLFDQSVPMSMSPPIRTPSSH
ncbi:hypothetical protein DFH29DRAFT_1006292 [Suillus ampliporus]|nr:hypothetical protein DFH29DRAFT_1006292 [Suillus ampliporus]